MIDTTLASDNPLRFRKNPLKEYKNKHDKKLFNGFKIGIFSTKETDT